MAKKKKFKLSKEQIKDLVRGFGGCIASDRITVDGLKVGRMYREASDRDDDSGWIFLSGDESQAYLDDPDNMGVYECNTIANYDRDIIPLLYEEPEAAFARANGGPLVPEGEIPPVPRRTLTDGWSFRLNSCFDFEMEDEDLTFSAPGRTIWMSIWEPEKGISPAQRLTLLKKKASPDPVERWEPSHPSLIRWAYLLLESDDERGARWAFYGATIEPGGGHLWMSLYFDRKEDLDWARRTWDSVEFGAK